MVENLWDGEMDCGWEDLRKKVVYAADVFTGELVELVSSSFSKETRELINTETVNRFVNLARLMAEGLQMASYCQYEDLDNKNENPYKLNSWILLGSLTECALQMFLAFFIDDYRNSKWKQWGGVDTNSVKKPIIETITKMVQEGIITSDQGRSLKTAIKEKVKEHTVEHSIQRVMLDEIIQYYSTMRLMDEDEIIYLKQIQSNRNGIHAFEGKTIGSWSDLMYCVRFWCYLLEWIHRRLPDIDYSD